MKVLQRLRLLVMGLGVEEPPPPMEPETQAQRLVRERRLWVAIKERARQRAARRRKM